MEKPLLKLPVLENNIVFLEMKIHTERRKCKDDFFLRSLSIHILIVPLKLFDTVVISIVSFGFVFD